jgi:threonine dehydratase
MTLLGATVFVKHENYQPIGAFKVRGGINFMAHLAPEERARGVVTASTGNHGQSVAYAAQLFGVRAVIVVPDRRQPGQGECDARVRRGGRLLRRRLRGEQAPLPDVRAGSRDCALCRREMSRC